MLITVVEHIKATSIPYTLLFTSHPYTDILAWDLVAPAPCGHGLILSIPAPDDCIIPGYAVEQIGDWVKVALKKPKKWIGTFLLSSLLLSSSPYLHPLCLPPSFLIVRSHFLPNVQVESPRGEEKMLINQDKICTSAQNVQQSQKWRKICPKRLKYMLRH
jgi:hypothetical protein